MDVSVITSSEAGQRYQRSCSGCFPAAVMLLVFAAGRGSISSRPQLTLYAPDLLFDRIHTIRPRAEAHVGREPHDAVSMQLLMAALHGGKHLVPVALDVRTICMKPRPEPCLQQY